MARFALEIDTSRPWHNLCDTTEPHVNGVGVPIARVLPEWAELICTLLNEHEMKIRI